MSRKILNYYIMSNSINISACDNELYLIAVNKNGQMSYQLGHVLSGYNNGVDVTINIDQGEYKEPQTQNGLSDALDSTYKVCIPKGEYFIMAVAIDWGGGQQVDLTINKGEKSWKFGTNGYNPGPFGTEVFWTNEGQPLTIITVA